MNTTKVNFNNKNGEKLAARLELPPNQKPTQYALFAHCFTCNKNLAAVRNVTRTLALNGFGILRFDFTGLGESEGDFADTNFSSNIDDLIAAADFLTKNYSAPTLVIGHSLGGAAAIYAGAALSSIKAIATIGAPSQPQHVQHLFSEGIEAIQEKGSATVDLGGRTFVVKKQFIEDLQSTDLPSVVSKMHKPIIIFHSPQDSTVGIENAAEIYQAARHPKSFISLDGADHLLSNKHDSKYTGDMIASWVKRYLSFQEDALPSTENQVVAQLGQDKYTTKINASGHAIIADEPESIGGNDFGPTPYDLISSGLGACTAITLKMYAERKKWDLQEVSVHINYRKRHLEDSQGVEEELNKIDHFEKIIELTGNLDQKQKERLIEIAEKCPVNKTLKAGVSTTTQLKQ